MKIRLICVQISYSNNNQYKNAQSFHGLTSIMSKRITINPDYLEKLSEISVREKGSVGNLPKDLFCLFRTNSKAENAAKIAQVKEALNEANKILAKIEEIKVDNAKKMNLNNLINAFLPKIAKINIQPDRIPRIITEMRKRFTPDKEVLASISDEAGKVIEKRLHSAGILKENQKVQLTYLDQGKYKNAFKLRFTDEADNDIIHPKVLLSFKSAESSMAQVKVLLSLMKEYFQNIKPKNYLSVVTNILDHASVKVVPPDKKEVYKKSLLDIYSKMKIKNEEQKFLDLIEKTMFDEIKYNGVNPESNLTQFIKRSAGHPMTKSNYIDIYYLNTLNNVGLSEFSDKALPPITKKINLYKYGLFHDDLILNKNNEVEGRVIDYGGIKPLNGIRELAENRIARRYYHKISQILYKDPVKTQTERIKYWNALYDAAIKASIPNHNDIMLALKKSKIHISQENWHLLADVKEAL